MPGRWFTTLLIISAAAHVGVAASPAQKGKTQPTDSKNYALTESNGPWMIFCASFNGSDAESDALALVKEFRERFRIPAYLHQKEYDFSKPVSGLGINRFGEPRKMRYLNGHAAEEFAVLIGNFSSVEDSRLQSTLRKIKYFKPNCFSGKPVERTSLSFAAFRKLQKSINGDNQKRAKGPLDHAFVTRNPLLPKEYFAPEGIDRVVLKMNRGLKYSLLDCPGKHTVRVATFRGSVVIDQKRIQEIESGGRMSSRLVDAAEKASRMVNSLRQRGVEAYQYHDRHASYVTVGSFDTLGVPALNDTATELDPRIYEIMKSYAPERKPIKGGKTGELGLVPRTLNGVQFDVQPYPMDVPRHSIAADYARNRF